MKAVILVCTFAAVVFTAAGAPALTDVFIPEPGYYSGPQPFLRPKRSYAGGYAAPCAAALPLAPAGYGAGHGSAFGGGYGGGGYGGGSYGGGAHAYAAPAYGGYGGGLHYRAEDAEAEMMNFSDMDQGMSEHQPMARYGGYGAAAGHGAGLGYGGGLAPVAASGPAFGVFPNANVGGCNVPLLLSCSPSIVPGRLVKGGYGSGAAGYGSGAAGYGSGVASVIAAPNAYRGVDEQTHQEDHAEETNHSVEHNEEATHTESQ